MADEKKPVAKRLGGLSTGPGAGRLGGLRSGDGAGPSSTAGGSGAGGAGGARKMRFMPTNFSRPKARPESTSEGAPSTSVSVASKSESAFEDLMKAAKSDAAWQRRGGRGGGRGFGAAGASRALTTFGGGAGEGGGGGMGGRRVWGGRGSGGGAAGSGGGAAGGAGGTKRLVKAGDKVKSESGGKVKSEDGGMDGIAEDDEEEAGGGWRVESSEESEGRPEEDPINYEQEYPVVLPHRQKDEPLRREPDDPAKVIPKDIFDLPEHYQPMLEEMSFLQDIEQNDGRLMLFQLPALLPVASQAGADGAPGTSVAASRPAQLSDLPTAKVGKLLVFESGKVKMQIGDVLLDVDPGIPPRFRQDVAVINPQSKQCVMLAPIDLRMVCSPNIETLLDPQLPLPEWSRAGAAAAAAGVGGSEGAPAAGGGAGRRAVVVSSDDEDEAVAMDVDGEGKGRANGAVQQQQQQQQQPAAQQQQQQQQGPPGVAIKKEEGEEEEVVSPRRGGGGEAGKVRSPRGGGVRSPRAGLRSPKAQQRGGGGEG
ncbi:hypothetical protein ABPG75_005744 [Micractinium tetrahymenae]